MSDPFVGKVVLITGAARGIGAETARRLASRGAQLALVGLEPQELERVAAECGTNAAAFEADVTDQAQLARAVEGAVERFGGIDVCMANAGIGGGGPVRHMDPEAFERIVEVNLLGVYRTIHACLEHVIARRGYVLVIASAAALIHGPGMAAYAASKAGVEALSDSLRLEVRHLGVDVGVGYLTWIDTDMVRGTDEHPALGAMRQRLPKAARKTYPVSTVGAAIVNGIETRARMIVVPGFFRAFVALRGLLWRFTDRDSLKIAPDLDKRFAEQVAESGAEASLPFGAGGRADRRR